MELTEIRVFPVDEDKLRAYVTVTLDHCFVVRDLKIIRGTTGLFVSMPSKRRKDGTYKDIAHPEQRDAANDGGEDHCGIRKGACGCGEASERRKNLVEGRPIGRFGDGRSPSGKAPDFGSGIEGSNPSRPANIYLVAVIQANSVSQFIG